MNKNHDPKTGRFASGKGGKSKMTVSQARNAPGMDAHELGSGVAAAKSKGTLRAMPFKKQGPRRKK